MNIAPINERKCSTNFMTSRLRCFNKTHTCTQYLKSEKDRSGQMSREIMSEQQFVTRYRLLDVYVLPESYKAIDTANDVLVSESSTGVVLYLNRPHIVILLPIVIQTAKLNNAK